MQLQIIRIIGWLRMTVDGQKVISSAWLIFLSRNAMAGRPTLQQPHRGIVGG
jgi:hypothetical protein